MAHHVTMNVSNRAALRSALEGCSRDEILRIEREIRDLKDSQMIREREEMRTLLRTFVSDLSHAEASDVIRFLRGKAYKL